MSSRGRPPCAEGVVRAAPDQPGCDKRDQPWVLAATVLGSTIAFNDDAFVSVALPAIQREMVETVRGVQWVVNANTLMLAALILIGGSAGDRFGRRRIFVLGMVVFAAASLACAAAPNAATLIAARAAQGVGGALLVPSCLALISANFAKNERGRAFGTWAAFSAFASAIAPIVGGWVVDGLSWRWIFFINVPIALLTIGIAYWRVPESRDDEERSAPDWAGGALATLGLAALAYGLTEASILGWTHFAVIGTVFAGGVALAAFLWLERSALAPMLPLELFRSATFSGTNALTLLLYFALSGALFFVPFNLIQVQGYSAVAAGAAFLPFTLIMGGLSRWSGALMDRYGAKLPLIVGPLIAAAGFGLLAVPAIGGSYWISYFPGMAVLGLGMAFSVAPLTTAVMGAVPDRRSGIASAVNNAVASIAALLAVAIMGAVVVAAFDGALGRRMDALRLAPEVQRAMRAETPKLAEAKVPAHIDQGQRRQLEQALSESFVESFRLAMLLAAALSLLSALTAALTIASPRTHKDRKNNSS